MAPGRLEFLHSEDVSDVPAWVLEESITLNRLNKLPENQVLVDNGERNGDGGPPAVIEVIFYLRCRASPMIREAMVDRLSYQAVRIDAAH
jgi:hypothetical protein